MGILLKPVQLYANLFKLKFVPPATLSTQGSKRLLTLQGMLNAFLKNMGKPFLQKNNFLLLQLEEVYKLPLVL